MRSQEIHEDMLTYANVSGACQNQKLKLNKREEVESDGMEYDTTATSVTSCDVRREHLT